jgi:hypothetical protein
MLTEGLQNPSRAASTTTARAFQQRFADIPWDECRLLIAVIPAKAAIQ